MGSRVFKKNEFILFIVLILLIITLTLFNKSFLSLVHLFDIIKNNSEALILAIGFFIVLLSGGIDLSFAAVGIFCAFITTDIMTVLPVDNILLAFLISCSIGIFLGSINALFISVFKIPSLITTLGTFSIFNAILLIIAKGRSFYSSDIPDSYQNFGKLNVFTINQTNGDQYSLSVYILIAIAIIVLAWFILKFTILGKAIYAIGGNQVSAVRSGFNIIKTQFFIYCFMGFLAGISAIMQASRLRSVITYGGGISQANFMVIAAVILGGASISGGYGSILGTILGVSIISILNDSLVLIGLSSLWSQFFIGIVIIIGISITSLQVRYKKEKQSNL